MSNMPAGCTDEEPKSCGSLDLYGDDMKALRGLFVGDEIMLHLKVKVTRLSSHANEYEGKVKKDASASYDIQEVMVMPAGQSMDGLYEGKEE